MISLFSLRSRFRIRFFPWRVSVPQPTMQLEEIFGTNSISLTNHDTPQCFLWDFNTTLGARENNGSHQPARIPMEDFSCWSDINHLLHITTIIVRFTWRNGRRGSDNTKKRLYRAICNQSLFDDHSSISCTTLVKTNFDH